LRWGVPGPIGCGRIWRLSLACFIRRHPQEQISAVGLKNSGPLSGSGGMVQVHRIAILVPLLVGTVTVALTLFFHALPLRAAENFIPRERRLGRAGISFWIDTRIVVRAIFYALAAHLFEMSVWALLLMACAGFGTACYHSAVNDTSLGYGDPIAIASRCGIWRPNPNP
jgi:hypothetical protein